MVLVGKRLVLDVDENTGLVTPEIIQEGIKNGGRLLLLSETMGILPNIQKILDPGDLSEEGEEE